ncbi:hypothetical protein ACFL35_08630 [Candidatus Riflebacteria bacterium]
MKQRALQLSYILFVMVFFHLLPCAAGSPQFLWKPKSEGDGKLVVLFPSYYRIEKTRSCRVVSSGASEGPTRYDQTGSNGDRIHARFSKPGSAYGRNVRVVLIFKNGGTVKWLVPNGAQRFEKNGHGSTGGGALDDVFDEVKGPGLSTADQGTKTFTVKKDGKITISACLRTYGPASLKASIADKERMNWTRSNDNDPTPLKVDGKAIESSIYEEKPGDPSAKASAHEFEVKEGDEIVLTMKGKFGQGDSHLKIVKGDDLVEEGKGEKDKEDKDEGKEEKSSEKSDNSTD